MNKREFKNDGEVLYIGSGNEEAVKVLQQGLKDQGYTDGHGRELKVDGEYGPKTFNAVLKYQGDNYLKQDGKVGDKTWDSIWDNEESKQKDKNKEEQKFTQYSSQSGIFEEEKNGQKRIERKQDNQYEGAFNGEGDLIACFPSLFDWLKNKKRKNRLYSPDGYVEEQLEKNAKLNRDYPSFGNENEPDDTRTEAEKRVDLMDSQYWNY